MTPKKAAELLTIWQAGGEITSFDDVNTAVRLAIPLLEAAARTEEEAHKILKRWKGVLTK